ncbi:MAG: DUF362 domain-containing protein [Candidatus Aminicenantes bacterium]|jgi:uncharacterized protein (DUF362 family)
MMDRARVVIVRIRGNQDKKKDIPPSRIKEMFTRGFSLLSGQKEPFSSIRFLFNKAEKIGIKINTLGGRNISTNPETSLALADVLSGGGIKKKNIIIWDRTNRELKEAGYRLNSAGNGYRIFGTDTEGIGYGPQLVSHLNIGSLFSAIQTRYIHSSISLAILKDHGLAGVTAGMKNYYGAVHNPNKYHDFNCNPFVAEVFDTPMVKKRHKISILDALTVQYHRGPSYHSQWTKDYGGLVFSLDPVAADSVGWTLIEKFRAEKGFPSLEEEQRKPLYLETAAEMGLGTTSPQKMDIIEEEI